MVIQEAEKPVLIAGGGIGGLATALTLHQIGVPFLVLEAARELRPLGVGINLQPNAIRELFALGLTRSDLDKVGLPITEWALVGLNGHEIYCEPRGEMAGYKWPQYAVHRGRFHLLLRDLLIARAGPDVLQTDRRVIRYQQTDTSVSVRWQTKDGASGSETCSLLIGADGIHSSVRSQMHPADPDVHWGGVVMWRGTSRARAIRGPAAFIGLGTNEKRVVLYPISRPDPHDGLSEINWIAEVTLPPEANWPRDKWFTQVQTSAFAQYFSEWTYDWLDVPAMIKSATAAFENPMIDRNPLPHWHQGRVALLGDAAHAMYPTGSNGATQALIDARELGACLQQHGVNAAALSAYNDRLCAPISALQLRNRADGPFGLLKEVDRRCGGHFDDIDAVISPKERNQFMAEYKSAAGFAVAALNAADPIIRR